MQLLKNVLLSLAFGLTSITAYAQVAAPAAANAAPIDAMAEASRQVGIKRCLPAITRLSSFNLQGSKRNDVLLDWDRKNPDAGPMFSLSGIEFQNASVAVSMNAVPTGDQGCTVAVERISVAPYTCKSIAQQELAATHKATPLLPTMTVYTQASDPGASISLIDSPPGCLIIRRYVQYDWKDPNVTAAPVSPSAVGSTKKKP